MRDTQIDSDVQRRTVPTRLASGNDLLNWSFELGLRACVNPQISDVVSLTVWADHARELFWEDEFEAIG